MAFAVPAEAGSWLTDAANAFMLGPDNDLHLPGSREPAFDLPLVAFAAGDDPIWENFKEHVGPYHWTPLEAFSLGYPGEAVRASELTVMSWILPQTEATLRDHGKERELPAERWARSRFFGEEHVNGGLRRHMLETLRAQGIQAVAPFILGEWRGMPSEAYVFSSTWSERHAAHAAGLGTFGLCDGLITPRGKAMRAGSVVMRLAVPANERPYTDHREYCLFFSSGVCGACIKRCPVGALSPEGHDKRACKAYLYDVTARYVENTWHFGGYGCGLCQVAVPCERRIPPKPKSRKT
jgi:NAD-dependent dihydropyrimidine dehydrogenase PreA subunit